MNRNEGVKIVTIGGGSSYTPELMNGFISRYDRLPVREIWLVDIEDGREKLEIVGALAQRMWDKSGHDVKVHLTLDRREAALHPGDALQLTPEVKPADASERAVRWSSSDESVAVVDENGLVTAMDRGTAEIRAETADGFCADVCVLSVKYTFGQWLRSLFG